MNNKIIQTIGNKIKPLQQSNVILNMQNDTKPLVQSQKDIETLYQTNNISQQKDQVNEIKKNKIHEFIKNEFGRKNNKIHLPTVRKIMQVLNSPNLTPKKQLPKDKIKNLANSHFTLLDFTQSKQSNHNKKQRNFAKILSLKKDLIEKIGHKNENQQSPQIQKQIHSLFDEIHYPTNPKGFLCQSHFRNEQSFKNIPQKRNIDSKLESEIRHLSDSRPYKTIQSPRSLSQHVNHKRQSMKLIEQMNKIQAQKAYIQTIKQLDSNKKFQLQKKKFYFTIDPNKTEKWFSKAENSSKKLIQLFKEKNQLSNEKPLKSPKVNNEFVSKLLQKSNQQFVNLTNEVKQLTQGRDRTKSLVVKDIKQSEFDKYKRKQRQYFRIEVGKQSSSHQRSKQSLRSNQSLIELAKILPQIKVKGKKSS